MKRPSGLTDADEKFLAEYDENGADIGKIAKLFGITKRRAANILERAERDNQTVLPLRVEPRKENAG